MLLKMECRRCGANMARVVDENACKIDVLRRYAACDACVEEQATAPIDWGKLKRATAPTAA